MIYWRVLLVIVASLLTWRIASFGICEYYLGRAAAGDDSAIDRALAWNPRHPGALYRKAQRIRDEDPADAVNLLTRSFAENPSFSFPLLSLALVGQYGGNQERAGVLVEKASELMPANPRLQLAAGGYWASRGNLVAAFAHWSRALEASMGVSDKLFPILLKLAEEPRTIGLFKSVASSPPSWWGQFFQETAKRALQLETVRTLYAFRRTAKGVPLTPEERDSYLRRLQREGKITEAYLLWVNGLDEAGRAHLGILNNGNFEIGPTNTGFDWHLQATDQVTAKITTTAGVVGEKALHLVFKRREKPFGELYQPLFLDPGVYRVAGRVRVDSLDSQGGLKWIIVCLLPKPETLGESERFLGSSEWREFSFEARVPEECGAQEIRLVSAGRREFEHKMSGGIWFDAISMRKVLMPRTDAASSLRKGVPGSRGGRQEVEVAGKALEVSGGGAFNLAPSLIESLGDSKE